MNKIRTKLTVGILIVFLISYAVFIQNIGVNQLVVRDSQSLLTDNYPSVKYSFNMLHLLESVNVQLLSTQYYNSDSNTIEKTQLFINDDLSELQKQLELQQSNITEPGERELTESLHKALIRYQQGIYHNEYETDFNAYLEKYENLKEYILNIHDLNISLLEIKNEEIRSSTSRILKVQKNVGTVGLAILGISIVIIPFFLLNPIDRLTERMTNFYKTNFNKDIDFKKHNELEKLEEIFEKIVMEACPDDIANEQSI
jgi:methyl-accepting chemotaxis protein